MTGGMFSVPAGLLKERGMVSRVPGAMGSWRAAEQGESLHSRLRVGSEAGVWPEGRGTPALSHVSSLSTGPCPLCWLPPQWLCPGCGHSDWQVKLNWAFGEGVSAPLFPQALLSLSQTVP